MAKLIGFKHVTEETLERLLSYLECEGVISAMQEPLPKYIEELLSVKNWNSVDAVPMFTELVQLRFATTLGFAVGASKVFVCVDCHHISTERCCPCSQGGIIILE